jgi:hypothetical protein
MTLKSKAFLFVAVAGLLYLAIVLVDRNFGGVVGDLVSGR